MTVAPPASLNRARRLSAVCATGCVLVAIAAPLAVVGVWSFAQWRELALVRLIPPDLLPDLEGPVQLRQRLTGAGICLVPTLLLSYGLLRARWSLAAFVRADFFAADVVSGLRDYASFMFWATFAGLVSVPVLSLALTLANRSSHRELSLDLSGAQLLSLLGAAILWVIGSVMAQASTIARENAQFIWMPII